MTVMTRDEVLTLLDARQAHWRTRNPDGLAASHAPDGQVLSPIFGTVSGRPAILNSYRQLFHFFTDWTLEVEETTVDGDRASQVFTVTATHQAEMFGVAPTGRRFQIHGVLVFNVANGLIARERRFYDFTGLLVQLGILKAKM